MKEVIETREAGRAREWKPNKRELLCSPEYYSVSKASVDSFLDRFSNLPVDTFLFVVNRPFYSIKPVQHEPFEKDTWQVYSKPAAIQNATNVSVWNKDVLGHEWVHSTIW